MSCVRCHRKEGSPLSFAWLLVNECHSSRYQSFGVFLFILSGGSGFWWFQHSVVLQIYHTSTCLNLTSKGITETPFWAYFPGIHSNLNVESNRLTKGSIGSTIRIFDGWPKRLHSQNLRKICRKTHRPRELCSLQTCKSRHCQRSRSTTAGADKQKN